MRTRLSALFCVAAVAGFPACDDQPVSGPTSDDQLALYDFRAGAFPDNLPNYPGDGDIAIVRRASPAPAGDGGADGGDIILFDIVGASVHDSAGDQIQTLSGASILSADGATVCSKSTAGIFSELRDANGTVLYSTYGPWVFSGAPQLDGLNPAQQYAELSGRLMLTFDGEDVVDGFPLTGEAVVESSEELVFASSMRKLVITSLVDGSCGSAGVP